MSWQSIRHRSSAAFASDSLRTGSRDGEQPRQQRSPFGVVRRQMVEGRQKDVLRDIFGIVFIADQVASEAEDRLMILLNQFPKLARLPG